MNTECRKAYHVPTLIQQTTDALLPIHKKAPILPKGREPETPRYHLMFTDSSHCLPLRVRPPAMPPFTAKFFSCRL